MSKVICDVCGTAYPETASQCPICGCARADGGQTSAGNTVADESEKAAYTYVRGGRFSKSNVRKRMKDREDLDQKKYEDTAANAAEQDNADEEDREDMASNKGLIAIILVLLVAIIGFSAYIAIEYFDLFGKDDVNAPIVTTAPTAGNSDNTTEQVRVPCTDIVLVDTAVSLKEMDSTWQLSCKADPADTTDEITYASSDESVVTVDENGVVTAVGKGEAVIRISCGSVMKECKVVCDFTADPTNPTGEGETTETEPAVFELSFTDVTLDKIIPELQLYRGELDPTKITWSTSDETVATVENGLVRPVSVGTVKITAEYEDQKDTCVVRVTKAALDAVGVKDPTEETKDPETTEPGETTEPTEPEETTAPTEPEETTAPEEGNGEKYALMINNAAPKYQYKDRENTADITISLRDTATSFKLTIVNDQEAIMSDVEWSMDEEGICTIDGRTVTAKAEGIVFITTTYEGVTYTVRVIVRK